MSNFMCWVTIMAFTLISYAISAVLAGDAMAGAATAAYVFGSFAGLIAVSSVHSKWRDSKYRKALDAL